ncbi:hypothetical protein B0H11DRAFT_2219040 [Mycena galericulata]|nr:hypothetical protein B0H11DRAFT_2219040 [Mycena galericulata]
MSGASSSRPPLPITRQHVSPLALPRHRYFSTAVLLSGHHSRAVSSSWTPRCRSDSTPLHIDVAAEPRPKVRPLPQIPITPKSAPPNPRRHTAPLRPLPRVPEASVAPELDDSPISVSVTPASPMGPESPIVRSTTHLSPPRTLPTPRRFASLSLRLDPSPDALAPRVPPPSLPNPPPATPAAPIHVQMPVPPSPNTARRRRISKLRRHLGESIALELFPDPRRRDSVLESDICLQTAIAVQKLLEVDASDADDSAPSSDDGDGDDDDDDDDGYSLVLAHEQASRSIPVKRYSRKWIREKGSKQWVEENYSDILRDLRALRI